jgi:hypothetical protein
MGESATSDITGQIPLHDNHAIGLRPDTGKIGLHPIGNDGWMIGIRLNVDLMSRRKAGESGGFMTLDWLEITIPTPLGDYVGRIEGWNKYKTIVYNDYFKPATCSLKPYSGDFVTFSLLDAMGETDPYFYFQWGLRTDQMAPYGYRSRATVAYLGVNFPVQQGLAPSWTEVPSNSDLLRMLKPSIITGLWKIKAGISSFQVDSEVTRETHLTFHVWEGWRRYYRGAIDFVMNGARLIGKSGVDWSDINWGDQLSPGDIEIMSGIAKGRHFRVVKSEFTGQNPPYGYPPDTWILTTDLDDPIPGAVGVKEGDLFQVCAPYDYDVYILLHDHVVYPPGVYPSQELNYHISPIL